MASKRFEKNGPEWLMFQDYWRLCQQFWEVEDNDQYWRELTNEADIFYKKHKNVDKNFAMKLAVGYMESLKQKHKDLKGNK